MKEEDRVREKIAETQYILWSKSIGIPEPSVEYKHLDQEDKDQWLLEANQILSIKGLRIEADDQSLPFANFNHINERLNYSVDIMRSGSITETYNLAIQDMTGDNWVRVIPKPEI